MKNLEIMKTHSAAVVPSRAYAHDAGLDLVTLEGANLKPGEGRIFPTGIAVAIDPGYVGLICDRSSMESAVSGRSVVWWIQATGARWASFYGMSATPIR
jgi:dUTP pyrophosphatase